MANIGSNDWNAVTYGNGRYVTVGDSNSAACSIDGINWTATSGFNDLSGISNYTADIVERLLFTYKILDLYPEILEEKDIL